MAFTGFTNFNYTSPTKQAGDLLLQKSLPYSTAAGLYKTPFYTQPSTDNGVIKGTGDIKTYNDTSNKKTNGSSNKKNSNGTNTERTLFLNDLNDEFGDSMNWLNKKEQGIRNAFSNDILPSINSQFDAQIPLYQQARDTGLTSLDNQQTTNRQNETNLLNSARQLYNELGQRNQNIFSNGALSSVGQASSEILGREAQRNFGGIRQNAVNTAQLLTQKADEVRKNYDTQIQVLESKRQQALSQARLELQNMLNQINDQRGQLESWKRQERIQALKDYRDKSWNIEAEARQFAYNLKLQGQSDLDSIRKILYGNTNTAVNQGNTAVTNTYNDSADTAQDFSGDITYGNTETNPYMDLSGSKKKSNIFEDIYGMTGQYS